MINPDSKQEIIGMFLAGTPAKEAIKRYPEISKSTIYNLRGKADILRSVGMYGPGSPRVVGVIGDTHFPWAHPNYIRFVKDTFERYQVTDVVHIGDAVDNHAMSYHEADPDGRSAGDEWLMAMDRLAELWEAFPKGTLISGNHDNIPMRRLKSAGLTKRLLRENIYNMPEGWVSRESIIIADVHYSHGIGMAGMNGHKNNAVAKGMSSVMGHCHSFGGVAYIANPYKIYFGMNVGCGIDVDAYAMEYGKYFPNRPTLGCGIVFNSEHCSFVPMDMVRYSRHSI